jgi:hypothetical protein
MLLLMPRPRKAAPEAHGAKKKQFQFMLTEEASELIDLVADELGISRSEALERAVRSGAMKSALTFEDELQTA